MSIDHSHDIINVFTHHMHKYIEWFNMEVCGAHLNSALIHPSKASIPRLSSNKVPRQLFTITKVGCSFIMCVLASHSTHSLYSLGHLSTAWLCDPSTPVFVQCICKQTRLLRASTCTPHDSFVGCTVVSSCCHLRMLIGWECSILSIDCHCWH